MSARTLYPCGQMRPDPAVPTPRSALWTAHVLRCAAASCIVTGAELLEDLAAWRRGGAVIEAQALRSLQAPASPEGGSTRCG